MPTMEVWPWWIYCLKHPWDSKRCKTLMRLMTGEHLLQSNTYHRTNTYSYVDSPNCKLCTNFCCETVSHMLFTCPKFSNQRTYMWENVKHLCPDQLFLTLNDMDAKDKMCLFCQALNANMCKSGQIYMVHF